jgi:hypothetical protein
MKIRYPGSPERIIEVGSVDKNTIKTFKHELYSVSNKLTHLDYAIGDSDLVRDCRTKIHKLQAFAEEILEKIENNGDVD